MRVVHFDCFSGISGDMTLAALIDAGADESAVRAAITSLGLPISFEVEKMRRGGFAARQVFIEFPKEDVHRHLPEIETIIDRGALTDRQRDLAKRVFRRLAECEAEAHGMPVEKVHFHEVGALDSIADIVGSAVALDLLGADKFTSRSVPTGHGTVKCAHGLMPVPAPATAALLKGVPLAPSPVKAELTTPTGAAILTSVVTEWTESPVMTVESIGHGAGRRDFVEQPNLLRVFVGTAADTPDAEESDTVCVLETNLDDVPGEVVGYTLERLLAAGALDAFTQAVQMKKNRPGVLLTVLCGEADAAGLEAIMFRETGTFGVRRTTARRAKLRREWREVATPWGPVRCKHGRRDGAEVLSPEYEDCAKLAREHGVALREVYEAARRAGGVA